MKTQRFVCSPSGVCVHPVGSGEATERTELLGRGGGSTQAAAPGQLGGLSFALPAWERIQQLVGAD